MLGPSPQILVLADDSSSSDGSGVNPLSGAFGLLKRLSQNSPLIRPKLVANCGCDRATPGGRHCCNSSTISMARCSSSCRPGKMAVTPNVSFCSAVTVRLHKDASSCTGRVAELAAMDNVGSVLLIGPCTAPLTRSGAPIIQHSVPRLQVLQLHLVVVEAPVDSHLLGQGLEQVLGDLPGVALEIGDDVPACLRPELLEAQ